MERIASFSVDHDKICPGMYISRIDGDTVTFDVRMKKPNGGDYLSASAAHTMEHLLATFMRNSAVGSSVVYVGPMGCRTGFYVLLRDDVKNADAIKLIYEGLAFVRDFEGEIPGNTRVECGNYLDHDLAGAKEIARDMTQVLKNWTEKDLIYKE